MLCQKHCDAKQENPNWNNFNIKKNLYDYFFTYKKRSNFRNNVENKTSSLKCQSEKTETIERIMR